MKHVSNLFLTSFDSPFSTNNQSHLRKKTHWTLVKFAFSLSNLPLDKIETKNSLFSFLFKRKVAGGEGSPRRRLNFSRGTCYPTKKGYIYIYIYTRIILSFYTSLEKWWALGGGWKGEGRWKRRAPCKMFEDIKLFRCWKLYPLKINKPSGWKRGKMVAVRDRERKRQVMGRN